MRALHIAKLSNVSDWAAFVEYAAHFMVSYLDPGPDHSEITQSEQFQREGTKNHQ